MNHTDIEEREQDALNSLEDARERIKQLEEDLRDMTKLAVDYKEANTRLEDELREFHAKDGGRTREHNLLVQENRKLKEQLDSIVSPKTNVEMLREILAKYPEPKPDEATYTDAVGTDKCKTTVSVIQKSAD